MLALGAFPSLSAPPLHLSNTPFCSNMPSFQEYRRLTVLPLTAVALAAYYLFFYLPLERRSRSLDAPLQQAWKKLAESVDQTNAVALDFAHITNQLAETRQALAIFENTKTKAV